MVSEVNLKVDSTEKAVVGALYIAAFGGKDASIVVWDSDSRIDYDMFTGKVYLPPDFDQKVSPQKLQNLTGEEIGDSGILGGDEYYVYSTKPGHVILAKGRILGDISAGNYTSEFMGYKFKLYGPLAP
jgi:hypothetical protein